MQFTGTLLYEWNQKGINDDIVPVQRDKIVHTIMAFEIKQIPAFNDPENKIDNSEYIESLLRQKTFIDTVNSIFFLDKKFIKSTLELRIINNPDSKIINCYLLLRVVVEQSTFIDYIELVNDFKNILPEDYIFTQLVDDDIEKIIDIKNKVVVEVQKNTNLIPVGVSNYEVETIKIPSRRLTLEAAKQIRYHVPVCCYVEPKTYNLSNLYKLLQDLDEEVQIRISLSSAQVYEVEKNIALQFHNLLRSTYGHLNSMEMFDYERAYAKYINSSELYSIKLQIAANSEKTAMYVSNTLCSQLAFGEIKTQINLRGVLLKDESRDIIKLDWKECNHYYYSSFKNFNFDIDNVDSVTQAFMIRLPYLCDGNEIMALFRLPVSNSGGLPGMVSKTLKPFYQPNPKQINSQGEIKLGKVVTSKSLDSESKNALDYTLPIEDLTKHGLIVGSTGSGKTNTTLNFVRELTEKNISFLLIEPVKSEYYDELKEYFKTKNKILNRFNFKRPLDENGNLNLNFFRFNPLIPIEGISVMQHISYIKGCFNAAFPMHGIMPMIFEECIYQLYNKYCMGNKRSEKDFFDPRKSPKYLHNEEKDSLKSDKDKSIYTNLDLRNLETIISEYLNSEANKDLYPDVRAKQEFGGYLLRRITRLKKGLMGNVLSPYLWRDSKNTLVPNNIELILKESSILELEYLADNEEKALILAFVLTMLFEYRQMKPSVKSIAFEQQEKFKITDNIHVTIIEEAHRLLGNTHSGPVGGEIVTQDSRSKSISLFVDMLAEIRAKGEGIFIVEQMPTKLVADVIKNTNLKIMHRITSKDDRHYLGEAMSMNERQKNYVTNLKSGEAIIFEEQLDNPVFVKIDNFNESIPPVI